MPQPAAAPPAGAALNITAVYQDPPGREWAAELLCRMSQLMGDDTIANHAWNIVELDRPEAFSAAVAAATVADVLVISFPAGEQLPSILCAWMEAWLPRRLRRDGTLIALIGVAAGQPDARSEQTEDYLRRVAGRGRLDFQLREYVTKKNGTAA